MSHGILRMYFYSFMFLRQKSRGLETASFILISNLAFFICHVFYVEHHFYSLAPFLPEASRMAGVYVHSPLAHPRSFMHLCIFQGQTPMFAHERSHHLTTLSDCVVAGGLAGLCPDLPCRPKPASRRAVRITCVVQTVVQVVVQCSLPYNVNGSMLRKE